MEVVLQQGELAMAEQNIPFSPTLKALLRELTRSHNERMNDALQTAAQELGLSPESKADLQKLEWVVEAKKTP